MHGSAGHLRLTNAQGGHANLFPDSCVPAMRKPEAATIRATQARCHLQGAACERRRAARLVTRTGYPARALWKICSRGYLISNLWTATRIAMITSTHTATLR